jgi:hypothetical protein
MRILKTFLAGVLCLSLCLSLASCNTSWVFKSGKYEMSSGVYLALLITSTNEANSKVTDKSKEVWTQKIDKKDVKTWILDQTNEAARQFIGIEKKFDELKLSLTKEDNEAVESQLSQTVSQSGKVFEDNGAGEDSLKKVIINQMKTSKVFEKMYGKGGLEEVKDDTLKDYMLKNYVKLKYILMPLSDQAGTPITADAKTALKEKANGFISQLNAGAKIDELIFSYSQEQQKAAAAAAGQPEPEKTNYDPANDKQNEVFLSKTDTQYPEKYIKAVFADTMKINTPTFFEDEKYFFVTVKHDLAQSPETFTEQRTQILASLKKDDFKKMSIAVVSKDFVINKSSISKYDPKKIVFPKQQQQ